MRESFDAFISYRRNTGSTLANRIYDFFVSRRITLPSLCSEDKLGYLATIVVSEKYRGNGLATALINKVTRLFAKMNISHIITTAWKHIGKINLQGVLIRCGYKKITEIPDYWYEDSIKKGYSCPQCGNPCHCSCVIFEKF